MRFTRTKAVLAGLALAATAACGGNAGSEDEGGADVEAEKDAAASFEDGTQMKELADAGQDHHRREVRPARARLQGRGRPTCRPASTSRSPRSSSPSSASTRTATRSTGWRRSPTTASRSSQKDRVDLVLATYSITDERRQIVGQAGPYMVTGQQVLVKKDSDIKGIEDLKGKEVCSVTGLDLARERQDGGRQGASRLRHLLRVRGGGARRHRRRRCPPTARSCSGLRRAERGRAQGRRRRVLRGAHRRRLLQGPPGDVRVDQRHAAEVLRRRRLGQGVRVARSASPGPRPPSRRSWTPARA